MAISLPLFIAFGRAEPQVSKITETAPPSEIETLRAELIESKGILGELIKTRYEIRRLQLLPPVGVIMPFVGTIAPEGWAFCNGEELPANEYHELAELLRQTDFEKANDSSKLKLPNLCGEFLRGANPMGHPKNPKVTTNPTGSTRKIGSTQDSAVGKHQHHVLGAYPVRGDMGVSLSVNNNGLVAGYPYMAKPDGGDNKQVSPASSTTHPFYNGKDSADQILDNRMLKTSTVGDLETRPRNIAVAFIIKVR